MNDKTYFSQNRQERDDDVSRYEEREWEAFSTLFDNLNEEFESLGLVEARKEGGATCWKTRLHTDGSTDSKNDYTSSVYPNNPHLLIDHARGGKRLIWVLIDMGVYKSYSEALSDICRRAKIPALEISEEARQRIEESRKSARMVERLHNELINPEPKTDKKTNDEREAYAKYLTGERGWTGPEINHSPLGFITWKEAQEMGWNSNGIGRTHQLAIPLMFAGRAMGWTFRNTERKEEGKADNRYRNLKGVARDFLAEMPVKVPDGSIIIVEGPLDAIRGNARREATLQTKDIPPFVATCGGAGLTDAEIEDAKRRGVHIFILALDADGAGQEATRKAAERIWKAGLTAMFFEYPNGSKDMDEAFKNGLDIRDIEPNAIPYALAMARQAAKDIETKPQQVRAAKQIERMLEGCDSIGKRDVLGFLGENEPLKKLVDERVSKEATERMKADFCRMAASYIEKGQDARAQRLLNEIDKKKNIDRYDVQNFATLEAQYPDRGNIETPFVLCDGPEKTQLFLHRSAANIFAARTGHGKTAIMASIACFLLGRGKKVFYVTTETNPIIMARRFVDIWAELSNTSREEGRDFVERCFNENLLRIGKEFDPQDICDIMGRHAPDVIFIDYIQQLRPNGFVGEKKARLESACGILERFVSETAAAVVIGAQLNRFECTDPVAMDINSIADAIDIAQFADQIFGMWNSNIPANFGYRDPEKRKKAYDALIEQLPDGFPLRFSDKDPEAETKLYVKCLKARDDAMRPGFNGVFDITRKGAVTQTDAATPIRKTEGKQAKIWDPEKAADFLNNNFNGEMPF